jgi:hypothetical protein
MGEFADPIDLRLALYCLNRGLDVHERLGFGKDGSVWSSSAFTAIKVFTSSLRCDRERDVYTRLRVSGAHVIAGYAVPEVLECDEKLGVIEMTIVRPPFVLDFATAALDSAPDFPEEVLADWFAEKREQFGEDWPKAAAVVRALERLGIFMLDVHPGNIRAR